MNWIMPITDFNHHDKCVDMVKGINGDFAPRIGVIDLSTPLLPDK
jgi:hypothetical protein